MTPKQTRIIAVLALADIAIIAGLIALMAYMAHITALPMPTTHINAPVSAVPANPADETCQWQAAQRLTEAGLGGSVALTADGVLRFGIVATLAPGQAAADAAQLIWTAFDVALAMPDACVFDRIEVTVHIQDTATTLHAGVSVADLAAYSAGTLSEGEFIDRVTYTVGDR